MPRAIRLVGLTSSHRLSVAFRLSEEGKAVEHSTFLEWARLVVEALKALAWPGTIGVLLLVFRRPLSERLSAVRRAKFPGGVEIELGELQKKLEKSIAPATADVSELVGPSAATELVRVGDPMVAVANTRLQVEGELIRLSQVALGAEKSAQQGASRVIDHLRQGAVVSAAVADVLREYLDLTNRIVHTHGATAEEVFKALGIGSSLWAHLRYLYSVEYLFRDFQAHLLWHVPHGDGERTKYHFWAAIAAAAPDFDYNYDAFRTAAEKFNKDEERRAREADRSPRPIYVPPLDEFIEILDFRRRELLRLLEGKWWDGTEWARLREWQWPASWGEISWNGPIVRQSRNEAESELHRTDAALRHYRRILEAQTSETTASTDSAKGAG